MNAVAYIGGLLSDEERKNSSSQLVEPTGSSPRCPVAPGGPAGRTRRKGDRRYAWSRPRINGANYDPGDEHWLLARRSQTGMPETAYYICHLPARLSLVELVRVAVAGPRWAVEQTFQTAKGETGLDHYQVWQWTGQYRHITPSMFVHAFLTVIRSKKG